MLCEYYNVCPLRKLEEEGKINSYWREKYCDTDKNWQNCQRYQMEKRGEAHSDKMMPDGSFLDK
jgi:hypothetical protein